jgi:penicillin-binding protein 1A
MRDQVAFLSERVRIASEKNRECLDNAMSHSLIEMLVIAEDKRFWNHGGVDVAAVFRAIYNVVVLRQLQGASTIEQQLARTLTGYRKFSIKRKLREMVLACVIGDLLNKREAAVLYLCCAYYGWRMNSLAEACHRMGFIAEHISRQQSAELVARLKYPEPERASANRRALIANRAAYILRKTNKTDV